MPRFTSTHRAGGVQVDRLEGTDFIGAVAASSVVAGQVLVKKLINPVAFTNTRCAQFAPLYQRYRYTLVEFIYEPVAAATESGQLLGFCDYDVDVELPPNDSSNLTRGAAHQGQRTNQVWESQVYPMSQAVSYTDLYVNPTGEDPRLSYQGVFYLLASADMSGIPTAGNLYVRYVLELSIPQLQVALGSPAAGLYATTGFNPSAIFGTTFAPAAPNSLVIGRKTANQISFPNLSMGTIVVVAISGNVTMTGAVAGNAAITATWVNAVPVNACGTSSNFNSTNNTTAGVFTAIATASEGQITLTLTCSNPLTSPVSSDGRVIAVALPDITAGLAAKAQGGRPGLVVHGFQRALGIRFGWSGQSA
jgi:hypothetical protein